MDEDSRLLGINSARPSATRKRLSRREMFKMSKGRAMGAQSGAPVAASPLKSRRLSDRPMPHLQRKWTESHRGSTSSPSPSSSSPTAQAHDGKRRRKKEWRLSAGTKKIRDENPEFYELRNTHLDAAPTQFDISAVPSEVIAKQLTQLESDLFRKITPNELLFGNWKRSNKSELCPNIVVFINWFNRMTDWIISEVVMGLTVKRRARLLKKFINVADWCKSHGNFNTAMEIVSALAKSPVVRLKFSWAELSESTLKRYGGLRELLEPTTNYTVLRRLQDESISKSKSGVSPHRGSPTIPYFGILLQDLLAIEEIEGHTQSKLLNFKKLRRLSHAFQYFQERQADTYHLEFAAPEWLLDALKGDSLVVLDEDNQYKFSYLAESRDSLKAAGL
eukprot:TRINITY_DN2435_c0_g1_i2.p1 TRINITY_DN2435_c0_g1~~TRINITY_DN2435_c0_g1_i2.p1  ORF type:complete len:430 (+),score=51.52 TRINITY_DN2435_c0_g1_i2:118-1290(+)